jgi:outer membrane protein assembly factor BamB
MNHKQLIVFALICCSYPCSLHAGDVLENSGVKGGLVVCIGAADPDFIAGLRPNESYLVHVLDSDKSRVTKARECIRARELYGTISVDTFEGSTLPYVDNLVNCIVIDSENSVASSEIERVLAPLGVLMVKSEGRNVSTLYPLLSTQSPSGSKGWTKFTKPWPKEIDEWPQYLHGADNNAVAKDSVVGPPRHMQWVSDPAWSRSHMTIPTITSMVSAKGRLFSIEDRATPENPFLPGKWKLIARDAFNGVVLWTHDIKHWDSVTLYVKNISIQEQNRLAAIGDTVYCTLGIDEPISALDAATGKILRAYAGTERTQEFTYYDNTLFPIIGDHMYSDGYQDKRGMSGARISTGGADPGAPFGGAGFRGRYAPRRDGSRDSRCDIAAIDAKSGRQRWRISGVDRYVACTLAIKGRYAVYQTEGGLFCIDPKTGQRIWSKTGTINTRDARQANTVIITDNAVYSQEGKTLYAHSLKDGAEEWSSPIANNYDKSADVLFAGNLIWTGGDKRRTSTGYNPDTGKADVSLEQRMTGPMSHDRCYRNFITERFYINSKTGGADFLDLTSKQEFPHHWTRGTCGFGVLPCNGLLYAPPYSCQCCMGIMMQNFNAYYTEKGLKTPDQPIPVARKVRLEKGYAAGIDKSPPSDVRPISSDAWPTYRYDAARNGATSADISAQLKPIWKTSFKTTPSAPVIADGKVFAADVDAHTVRTLDISNGKVLWEYTTGARVDSPPTYYKGMVLFGSRDGWVYCLRASDGSLVWRFKDLPDKTIGAFGQLESAWPVHGSVLIENDVAYFCAGRNTFVDGGIFVYGLEPKTGRIVHTAKTYGPFENGLPDIGHLAYKADIMVSDSQVLYVRHRAFNPDLSDAQRRAHIIPSSGFVDKTPQHRTYWAITRGGQLMGGMRTGVRDPNGDILVRDSTMYYLVQGFQPSRHSYFDPRISGYKIIAGPLKGSENTSSGGGAKAAGKKRTGNKAGNSRLAKDGFVAPTGGWIADIPLTGNAMIKAGDKLFVAGSIVQYPVGQYERTLAGYEGKFGNTLWIASATDGKKLAEYNLDAPPVWDGMAAVQGKLIIGCRDGTMVCFGRQ